MVFPDPPHRLSPRYLARQRRHALIVGGTGALILLSGLWLWPREVRGIRRDTAIWMAGDSAPVLELRGTGTTSGTRRLFWDYRVEVRFEDAAGAPHQGLTHFTTLAAFADTQTVPYVRYLAATPDSFALSWAYRAIPTRWAAQALLFLIFAGAAGALLYFAYRLPIRQLRALAACASGPYAEVTLEVVGRPVVHARGVVHYKLRGRGPSGREYRLTAVGDRVFGQPLFLDPARRTVLALVADAYPSVPVVVRETLEPFAFSDAERNRLVARLGALVG